MTEPEVPPWQAWAPPLNPPSAGGLPMSVAEAIADKWWDVDPWYCAGLMWEAYAATLPATVPVSTVQTGAQTVTFSPPTSPGDFGAAVARADWYFDRSPMGGGLVSVPLTVDTPVPMIGLGWVDP